MMSLTTRLLKLADKRAAGKKAIVKVGGLPYEFVAALFGGTSPRITLTAPWGGSFTHSAAEWKRLGADL